MTTTGARTAAHLLVDCLAAEGCEYVFSVPGEETMDVLEALSTHAPGPAHHDPPRAGRGVHGRRLRPPHRPRRRRDGDAGAGRDEPRHRRRRRLPRPGADGRDHRPGELRQAPQGGPPGRRHRPDARAGDEVEHPRRAGRGDPRDRQQGVPARDAREARPDPRRAAGEPRRDGRRRRPRAADARQDLLPRADRRGDRPRRRPHRRLRSGRSSSPATACSGGAPRPSSGRSPAGSTCRSRSRSWARARSTTARTSR